MAAQLPDRIILNGEIRHLYSNPLESYWIKPGKNRPLFCSLINCKRGYIATWELKDHQLFLRDLVGNCEKRSFFFIKKMERYSIHTLFPRIREMPIKALWFSGKLRIPIGKITRYENTGYDTRFDKEIIITIEKGDVMKMVTLDSARKVLIIHAP